MGERFQFERNGFYIVDSIVNGHLYFNKIVGLVDREKRKIESKWLLIYATNYKLKVRIVERTISHIL